jgi:hypothetical protein
MYVSANQKAVSLNLHRYNPDQGVKVRRYKLNSVYSNIA